MLSKLENGCEVARIHPLNLGKVELRAENPVSSDGQAESIPLCAYLFETMSGWVLFDTGADPQGMSGNYPPEFRKNPTITSEHALLDKLCHFGLTPSDISCIVMSHLHLDHAGGLRFFPNAQTYVNAEELGTVLDLYNANSPTGPYMKTDIESWRDACINWIKVPSDCEAIQLGSDISIISFGPGHSFGSLCLLVNSDADGKFLFVADAIYSAAHIEPELIVPGTTYDKMGYLETVAELLATAEKESAEIIFGHDSEQFMQLSERFI